MISHVSRGEGRALILIPGIEGAKEFWRPQIDALSKRYRVIACDLPVLPPKIDRHISDYARPIVELMGELGVGSAVVMAVSFGGLVALEMAFQEPRRVDGLVLASALDRPNIGSFGPNMFTVSTAAAALALLPGLPRQGAMRLLRWAGRHGGFFLDEAPNHEELLEYALQYGFAAGAHALADRAIAASKAWYPERTGHLNVPVLLLRGAEDRLVSAAAFEALRARMPRAQQVLVPGAGHCCTLSAADEANRVILGWLDRFFAP